MLKLIIEDDEGRKTVVPFARDEITIGRQDGNTIRLTERNVSRRHARLVRQNGHVLIEDLGSYNGTRINGERIQGQSEVSDGDLIQIGDYDLALQSEAAASASPPAPARAPARKPQPVEEDDDTAESDGDEQEHTPPPAAAPRQQSTAVIRLDQVETNRSRKVQNLEPEVAPRLVILTADLRGQEYSCIRTEMRIGRTDENDITIDHRSVSGTHAKLVREDNGEWRILDMQSANGLTVNGESYAQASLKHGDIIELGHVKLRFVGAGKPVGSLNVDGGSKLPLILGVLVVLGALGGGGFYFLKKRAPATPGTTASTTEPKKGPEPIKPVTPKPPPQQATVAQEPQPTAVADASAEKLKAARDAMEARRFDEAVDILETIKDANGKRPADADALLDGARAERMARQNLSKANKELEAGKLDDAATTLNGVATQAFEKELADARAKLDTLRAAQKSPVQPATNSPAVEPKAAPVQGTVKAVDPAKLQELLTRGKAAFKAKQYKEAGAAMDQCLALDPSFADCHLVRGSVFASLNDFDKGAEEYRRFLDYAPNDNPNVPRIRSFLENYERQKAQK